MVAGVPVAFSVWGLLQYSLGWQQFGTVFFLFLLYLIIVLNTVDYDAHRMKQVNWEGVPNDVVDLLTDTTSKGLYVNLELLKIFNHTKLSQSELHELVGKEGIDLTLPALLPYIREIETAGLISTPPTTGTQAKQYDLTPRGRWCQSIIKSVLPRSYFMYYVRNYLGIRRLQQDPQTH